MLPQFGFTEFLMVAIVALIVLGPRDLSMSMRKLGQLVARGRAMAGEFRDAFDDIAKQAELDDLRQEIEDLKRENALTGAVDDLRAVEDEINQEVMKAHPGIPTPENKPAPAVNEPAEVAPAPEAKADPKVEPT